MADYKAKMTERQAASMVAANRGAEWMPAPFFVVEAECVAPDGSIRWRDGYRNVVVNEGKAMVLNQFFGMATNTSGFFLALHSASATASNHVVSDISGSFVGSHASGWPRLTFNTTHTGAQSTSQSASYSFTAGSNITVSGAAVLVYGATALATNTTANVSEYSEGVFGTARTIQASDVLNVTVTVSLA